MNTKDFYYDLPQERIAQVPLKDRSKSRLLDFDKNTGEARHRIFEDIVEDFGENDVLILNNTRVLPARMFGVKEEAGAKIEILLTKRMDLRTWEVMAKPAKRLKKGSRVRFSDRLCAEVIQEHEEGLRILEFEYEGVFEEIIDEIGTMPLPPYIREKLSDQERYQTVYSKVKGSSAAPTAGLHFTNEILERLEKKGVQIEYVTLHVGLGTFRPVQVESVEDHEMHSEYYHFSTECGEQIRETMNSGGRVIAVGTTSVRVLETVAKTGQFTEQTGWTDIFIYPGYSFHWVDGLITNFHLPQSTLLMLVSALAGRENMLAVYEKAVREKYRFFSFGDSMMIL